MNRAEAVDLANVIARIRFDWQQPGIVAALHQTEGTYGAVCLHAIRVALDPASQTPAAINATPVAPTAKPGAWHEPDYDAIATRERATANCTMCDERGYRGTVRCTHDPSQAQVYAAGVAAARAAIRPTKTYATEETTA